ncbi:MAG: hypothetical protein AAFS07_08530 [Pseudomonadota bacterium]
MAGAYLVSASAAFGDEASVRVELNKLEAQEGACQAFLVIENQTETPFDALVMDLVMFDPDGVIGRRLAVNIAPLRAKRTSVKVFAVQGLACEQIGRLLVNDVLECRAGEAEIDTCFDLLETASRTSVDMIN